MPKRPTTSYAMDYDDDDDMEMGGETHHPETGALEAAAVNAANKKKDEQLNSIRLANSIASSVNETFNHAAAVREASRVQGSKLGYAKAAGLTAYSGFKFLAAIPAGILAFWGGAAVDLKPKRMLGLMGILAIGFGIAALTLGLAPAIGILVGAVAGIAVLGTVAAFVAPTIKAQLKPHVDRFKLWWNGEEIRDGKPVKVQGKVPGKEQVAVACLGALGVAVGLGVCFFFLGPIVGLLAVAGLIVAGLAVSAVIDKVGPKISDNMTKFNQLVSDIKESQALWQEKNPEENYPSINERTLVKVRAGKEDDAVVTINGQKYTIPAGGEMVVAVNDRDPSHNGVTIHRESGTGVSLEINVHGDHKRLHTVEVVGLEVPSGYEGTTYTINGRRAETDIEGFDIKTSGKETHVRSPDVLEMKMRTFGGDDATMELGGTHVNEDMLDDDYQVVVQPPAANGNNATQSFQSREERMKSTEAKQNHAPSPFTQRDGWGNEDHQQQLLRGQPANNGMGSAFAQAEEGQVSRLDQMQRNHNERRDLEYQDAQGFGSK